MSDRQDERRPLTYRDAGVDIDAQDEALARIKAMLRATRTPGVLSELGSFGGLFAPDLTGMTRPVLVSSADGVGTKLRVAFETGIHATVGRDLVHHCVNDILVQGAMPLFFLDYVACGRLRPEVLAAVVQGIADGCRSTGCALLGGETAEMPGFYAEDEYDVAGFIVGIVDAPQLLDGSAIRSGDAILGLRSAGLHTNGYSLARKIFGEVLGLRASDPAPGLGLSVGEVLLAEHRCYLEALRGPLAQGRIHGLAHITGGGLTDNVPRVLPEGLAAHIVLGSWEVPPLFELLRRSGGVERPEMLRTFNMGVGMAVIVSPDEVVGLEAHFERCGETADRIGTVVRGERGVVYVES